MKIRTKLSTKRHSTNFSTITSIQPFLKEIGVCKKIYPDRTISLEFSKVKSLNCVELWKFCCDNNQFNIQLIDNSFIIFSASSYIFIESPTKTISYEEFIKECGYDYSEAMDLFYSEYEEYIFTAPKRENQVYIRYDFELSSYNEGIHPVSHLHFGMNNNIRISIKYKLTAISFTLFILRQLYPDYYKSALLHLNFGEVINKHKKNLANVPNVNFKGHDLKELYFN